MIPGFNDLGGVPYTCIADMLCVTDEGKVYLALSFFMVWVLAGLPFDLFDLVTRIYGKYKVRKVGADKR